MKLNLPAGEDWLIWRIITSPRTKDTRFQVEEEWTYEDVRVANKVYDALDLAEKQLRERPAKTAGQ